ncbi:MAG TPA: TetR/AcrR family transcriptional regulator [Mycobacteriales bacterium]|nr:TetR/AcrR family transcriptional regulator [Mycobacteriales bacterium]
MPGRPRDPARHEAVLAATRELLAESGYDALTFTEVAARAGVTRPLLYRWWPAKPALVSEALFARSAQLWPSSYKGPLRADLRAFIGALVDYAQRPDVRAGLLGIMAEARDAAELPALTELVAGLQTSFGALLAAGTARGEVRPRVDAVMTLDTIRGAVTAHVLSDDRPRRQVVDHLVTLMTWALSG